MSTYSRFLAPWRSNSEVSCVQCFWKFLGRAEPPPVAHSGSCINTLSCPPLFSTSPPLSVSVTPAMASGPGSSAEEQMATQVQMNKEVTEGRCLSWKKRRSRGGRGSLQMEIQSPPGKEREEGGLARKILGLSCGSETVLTIRMESP